MTEQQTAAMRQALSKIKAARDCHPNAVQTLIFEAEELLESTLEQQPADEPVAWMWKNGILTTDPDRADGTWAPLYTRPQPAVWVGLTDTDIGDEYVRFEIAGGFNRFEYAARAIEAKLKEKNQ